MPVRLRNTKGKNFGASELSGPNLAQKAKRAELLSQAPNLFTGNRTPRTLRTNDIGKSMGVSGLSGSVKSRSKFKREK